MLTCDEIDQLEAGVNKALPILKLRAASIKSGNLPSSVPPEARIGFTRTEIDCTEACFNDLASCLKHVSEKLILFGVDLCCVHQNDALEFIVTPRRSPFDSPVKNKPSTLIGRIKFDKLATRLTEFFVELRENLPGSSPSPMQMG